MKTKTIKKHENKYLHISKRSFKYISITILLILITIGSFIILIDCWKFLELGSLFYEEDGYNLYQLMIIPILIINYLLISLTICSIVSMFKKLKSYKEHGLILGLISGLIVGLIVGLIGGLISGLIGGLIGGLISGLISGLIIGLIIWLISGFISGLISGLIVELIGGLIEELVKE